MAKTGETDGISSSAFGPRFGRLIRSYREDLGLSVKELAISIWNNEDRTDSISKLENGKIKNPRAQTVREYALKLDIPQHEIDALRDPIQADGASESINLENISAWLESSNRQSLEVIALRFGNYESRNLTLENLKDFLASKANDLKRLEDRVSKIDEASARLSNVRAAAEAALRGGSLNQANDMLLQAIALQRQDRTIPELRRDSEIVELQAELALIEGAPEKSFQLLLGICHSYKSFDPYESARLHNKYGKILFSHGLRYSGTALSLACNLLQQGIDQGILPLEPEIWAETHITLGAALDLRGARSQGAEAISFLADAISSYDSALTIYSLSKSPKHWAVVKTNIGIALKEMAMLSERQKSIDFLQGAIKSYNEALSILREKADGKLWADANNAIGMAIKYGFDKSFPEFDSKSIEVAIEYYRCALRIRTREDYPGDWAVTQNNLANALRVVGAAKQGDESVSSLLEAISLFEEIADVLESEKRRVHWAGVQTNMAQSLIALSEKDQRNSSSHLRQATQRCDLALQVFDETSTPAYFHEARRIRGIAEGKIS